MQLHVACGQYDKSSLSIFILLEEKSTLVCCGVECYAPACTEFRRIRDSCLEPSNKATRRVRPQATRTLQRQLTQHVMFDSILNVLFSLIPAYCVNNSHLRRHLGTATLDHS